MKAILRKIRLLAGTIAVLFVLGSLAIVIWGLADRINVADVIIVPGNEVAADGTPSPRLQARLDAALRMFEHHRARLIFVSGGTGEEGFDEAQVMAEYLAQNGVPPASIVRDSQGVTTAATAANASRFMRRNGLKSAVVATQYFHVPRTILALQRNGVNVVGSVHARYFEWRDFYSIARETVAYAAYLAGFRESEAR